MGLSTPVEGEKDGVPTSDRIFGGGGGGIWIVDVGLERPARICRRV